MVTQIDNWWLKVNTVSMVWLTSLSWERSTCTHHFKQTHHPHTPHPLQTNPIEYRGKTIKGKICIKSLFFSLCLSRSFSLTHPHTHWVNEEMILKAIIGINISLKTFLLIMIRWKQNQEKQEDYHSMRLDSQHNCFPLHKVFSIGFEQSSAP